MKGKIFLTFLCLGALLAFSVPSHAIWWLFGRQEMPPRVSNVYIGNARGYDIDDRLVITQDQLIDDKLVVRGAAYSQKSPISRVMVSLDRGESWDAATIARPGNNVTFIYEFEPVPGAEYEIAFQAFDLQGMESEVWDSGYYPVMVSADSLEDILGNVLQEMASAYSNGNLSGFMRHVSIDFSGGADVLENAVRSDFDTYTDATIAFSILGVSPGRTGFEATVEWYQQLTERDSGRRIERDGLSNLYFSSAYNLTAIRGDVPFGFTSSRINEQSGTEYVPPLGMRGRFVLDGSGHGCEGPFEGYRFSSQQMIYGITFNDWPWEGIADLISEMGSLFAPRGIIPIEGLSMEEVSQPPSTGYFLSMWGYDVGDVFVVICSGDSWAVIEIDSWDEEWDEISFTVTVTIRYIYHDSGADLDPDYLMVR